jgi:predicted nucleic-acid-binding protein
MIAIDTNVLLRLLVNDDAAQADKARRLFDAHAEHDASLWIADVVLVELAWALERSYGYPRNDVAAALRALSGNASVQFESAVVMSQAIALYEAGPAGFADCLLAIKAQQVGCDALHTFDKKMRLLPGVKLF